MSKIEHLVMLSGGVASFACAKRVIDTHGPDGVVLLFADTKYEDRDLYRFLDEIEITLGVPITKLSDGRTPFQAMEDAKLIGNTRQDPCSRILKRDLLNKWRSKHCSPDITTTHFGIYWDEAHRLDRVRKLHDPWMVDSPLLWEPMWSHNKCMSLLKELGIDSPRMYAEGFAHNNCQGFCVKAGQGQFKLLLEKRPEVFKEAEEWENHMRENVITGDYAILRDRRGGQTKPLTLTELRKRIETNNMTPAEQLEIGGCACAIE